MNKVTFGIITYRIRFTTGLSNDNWETQYGHSVDEAFSFIQQRYPKAVLLDHFRVEE